MPSDDSNSMDFDREEHRNFAKKAGLDLDHPHDRQTYRQAYHQANRSTATKGQRAAGRAATAAKSKGRSKSA